MTIKVTISNDEQVAPNDHDEMKVRTILVSTIQYEKGKHGERVMQQQYIQPGQKAEFHIHLLTDLHVEELARWG